MTSTPLERVKLGTITSTNVLAVPYTGIEVSKKNDLGTQSGLPVAKRDRRIAHQQKRLRFCGDEEVAQSCYDLVFTIPRKTRCSFFPGEVHHQTH